MQTLSTCPKAMIFTFVNTLKLCNVGNCECDKMVAWEIKFCEIEQGISLDTINF